MAQIFQPYADTVVRAALVALAASPAVLFGAGYAIPRSPYVTGQFLVHLQPIPSATSITSALTDSIAAAYCQYVRPRHQQPDDHAKPCGRLTSPTDVSPPTCSPRRRASA